VSGEDADRGLLGMTTCSLDCTYLLPHFQAPLRQPQLPKRLLLATTQKTI
jgi:hypothetical protein